jgi:AcrR family transcriptional regulator
VVNNTRQLRISARKTPRQTRSALTVQAILEAAARVLATESLEGFNTNRVAEVAGVSIGSLYQYFPGKDALMATLIVQEQGKLAQAIETCVDANNNKPLQYAMVSLVRIAIAHQWGNPVYASALDHEELCLPVSDTLQANQVRIVNAVARLLRTYLRGDSDSELQQQAKDCVVVAKALIEAEPLNASRQDLERRVASILMATLGSRPLPRLRSACTQHGLSTGQ